MAGIYIHIPYCRQKCHYCNFFSVAAGKYRELFPSILLKEIELTKDLLHDRQVNTIYFGGGTPSLLTSQEIASLLSGIKKYYSIASDAEITLEANPDDLSPERCTDYMKAGVNRLSIGIQSFFDEDLEYLNRVHTAERALSSVKEAQKAGFTNMSIDLIYGIPGLTTEKWKNNIKIAVELGVKHISAYALTVEPQTPLEILIRKKKTAPVEDDLAVEHFRILMEEMKRAGYEHYEISNFCLPGYYSRHNTSYWQGIPYLGLGPSAHSFNGTSRWWNVASLNEYVTAIQKGELNAGKEILTPAQKFNEYVMVSLRTMWGCNPERIRNEWGHDIERVFREGCNKFIEKGWMEISNGIFFLTDEGKLHADGIASDLFLESEDGS